MKLIQHPNILQIYDVYEGSKELYLLYNTRYLVLEQVEGGELFDYLVKKGRLTENEALFFFQQIVCGVEYCHRHLICHRDLKPENLLLDKDYNIKIADFGMANLQVPSKLLETSCGSPHYASPEIIKGDKYDGPKSDVWSCGIVLFALLTGNLPFDDENIRRLLNKVKTGVYEMPKHISPLPRDLVLRLLTVDPGLRPTLGEVMEHPWFKSREPKNVIKVTPSIWDTNSNYPINFEFETDLLDSLKLLGWSNRSELLDSLHAQGTNAAKVYYNLIHHRKWELLENYDNENAEKYEVEGGPVRRAHSFSSNIKSENDLLSTKRSPSAKREGCKLFKIRFLASRYQ